MKKMLKVQEGTHQLVKISAAKAGMTIEEFMDYLIKKYIEENEK